MNKSAKLTGILMLVFSTMWLMADYPDKETTERYITSVPTVSMPGYLNPIIDPTFETTVTRISDQTAMGTTDTVIKQFYAKNQTWNCNGSLTRLDNTHGWILDGNSCKITNLLNPPISTYNGITNGALWSSTDPDIIYTVLNENYFYSGGRSDALNCLVSINVQTGARTLLSSFSPLRSGYNPNTDIAYDHISFGESEGNLTNDGRYVALQCRIGNNTYAHVYDLSNNTTISTLDLQGEWPDWVSMSQSGNYVVINWSNTGTDWNAGIQVYTPDLNPASRCQISTSYGHGDLGYDTSGNEVFVFTNAWDITGCRLDGGGDTVYLDSSLCGIQGALHISCRNTLRPGWCYVSDYGTYGSYGQYSFEHNEIFALKLDGNYSSPTLERFAHSHMPYYYSYSGCPMAVPNQDGTKVMFGNGWDAESPIYAYVTEKKGGNQVVRMSSGVTSEQRYARQSITITGDSAGSRTFTVSGKSKAENVSGSNHNDYSLYCDVTYTDGTYLYGQCAQFNTGTHDWETSSYTITPNVNKVVSSIMVYCMFRNKSGTVWFDDISLTKSTAPTTNLVQNPNFTTGTSVPLTYWTSSTLQYGLDQTSQVIKMSSSVSTETRYARQYVSFNRATGPITVSGKSKALSVSGNPDGGNYSIYCDVSYASGTPALASFTVPFNTGTHDWQIASVTIPAQTRQVTQIMVYCMFRNKSGTVWFEDMRMTESNKEPNLLLNPDFNTGTTVPIANWSSSTLPYTLTNK
ncbi:MAG: hypothetical protein WC721_20725 [Victivallaceae bacterium]|jgi:hypothetical protein